MIDHLSIPVSDLTRSIAFYTTALAPLGYKVAREYLPHAAGLSDGNGKIDLWLVAKDVAPLPLHVALTSPGRAAVDAFHVAAMIAGATDNGAAGPRPQYHAHYYGAFVLDPDGHNLEAVCHTPE